MSGRLLLYGFVLSACLSAASLRAQQLMLPPPRQQIPQPPGFNLIVSQMVNDDHGYIWAATDDGLVRSDGNQLRVFHAPWIGRGDDYGHVVPMPDGRVWVKVGKGILAYFDPGRQQIVRVADTTRLVREFLAKDGFRHLSADSRGNLWIGLHENGLIRVNPRTLAVDHIFTQKKNVRSVSEGPDRRIWFTTNTGVYVLDLHTGQIRNYTHDAQNPNTLGSNQTMGIRVRPDGTVLVSLLNEVDVLNPRTGQVKRMPLLRPSPTATLWTYDFVPDQQGNDYFSVGLFVFRYTRGGELQRIEFARPAEKIISLCIPRTRHSQHHRLWVNAGRRLDEYDLGRLQPLPALNLLDVSINGTRLAENEQQTETRLLRDSTGQISLTMQAGDFVRLRFSPFVSKRSSAFRYKLTGYDQQWLSLSDTIGLVTYQPPAGEFTFLLNRATAQGGWERGQAALKIRVLPHFWQTNWFLISTLLLVAGIGYYLIRTYIRRQQLRQQVALREQEAASLRTLDELKSQFFTNITHEFRTPLTLILHAAEQLAGRPTGAWEKERLSTIQRNADQLTRLISEILDISRMDAHKLEIYAKLGDPISFAEQHVQSFMELASQKQIHLLFASESDESILNGAASIFDDDKLGKIVYNLVSNALKFTPKGGTVSVRCGLTKDHQLVLTVSDTGIGINPEQLPRIFDRFYQADNSITRLYEGSGIGLAYVKELTQLMGGQIAVTSSVGAGSTFTVMIPVEITANVYFPVDAARVHRSASVSQSVTGIEEPVIEPAVSKADQPIILVVEDNTELRSYVAGQLRQDYQVVEAVDGRDGIAQALKAIPDLIVSDVMMPYVDGYELVSTLKNDERTSHIPIVLLTAKSSFDSKMRGLDGGADDYLGKPFSLSELSVRIRNGIRSRNTWRHYLTNVQSATSPEGLTAPVDNHPIPEKEKQFLSRLRQLVLDHLTDETVDVNWLADQARMSRTQLHRKLTALTSLSTTAFIHSVRLDKAKELLQTDQLTVAEVSYQVGYSSPAYFSKVFSEHFGYSPSKLTT